ncbi:hypothetical protein F4860DRAFT_488722 [Xylaria cubensis]|nr:hypothetical protein F4860DRAFT_488722 [Xylaria cubensis]
MDSLKSSGSSTQRIPCRDIDPYKLSNTLDKFFGESQYKLEMRRNNFIITAEREMTTEDISNCYYWQCAKGTSCRNRRS